MYLWGLKRVNLGTEMGVEFVVEIGTVNGASGVEMGGSEVTEMGLKQMCFRA